MDVEVALVFRSHCWWIGVHVDRRDWMRDVFVMLLCVGLRFRLRPETVLPIVDGQEDPLS